MLLVPNRLCHDGLDRVAGSRGLGGEILAEPGSYDGGLDLYLFEWRPRGKRRGSDNDRRRTGEIRIKEAILPNTLRMVWHLAKEQPEQAIGLTRTRHLLFSVVNLVAY